MTGYYTTEDLFLRNQELGYEFSKEFEIMDVPKDLLRSTRTYIPTNTNKLSDANYKFQNLSTSLPPVKETKNENLTTEESTKYQKELMGSIKPTYSGGNNLNSETPLTKNEKKDFLSKSVLPTTSSKKKNLAGMDKKIPAESKLNKTQAPKYSDYIQNFHMLEFYLKPKENVKESNSNFEKELEIFKEGLEKYKRKLRIEEMDKQIKFLTKKNEAIKELTKDVEEAIKHKKENLENVSNKLKPHQINFDNKLKQLKNNLNGRGQYQLVYDSFVYQKMAEVCFIFFNNKIQSLYTIPTFYCEPISNNDTKKMERLEYYNSDKKNISAMMGHICQLMIYLSKTFNIPLRFPIFLNGSRSYILRSVKDKMFLPLYLDAKKEDKHGNFENALNCLKDDIKEIFNFLSMFPEIVSKEDNKNVNDMNGKYLFFFFFVIFNHSLFRFMKTLQTAV